jgi:S-DNA-T family DNA segregation ATPase FtsK/SpoIIIE
VATSHLKKEPVRTEPDGGGMGEKKKELAGLFFILCTFFLFISLVTFEAGDITAAKFPANDPVENKGGKVGAAIGYFLLSNFGWAAFLVLFFAAFWSFKVFFRRKLSGLPVKLFSVVVSVLALSTFLSLVPLVGGLQNIAPSAGGIYGKALDLVLTEHLGVAGAGLAVVLALAFSLVLSTDWLLYSSFAAAGRWTWSRARKFRLPSVREAAIQAIEAQKVKFAAIAVKKPKPAFPVPARTFAESVSTTPVPTRTKSDPSADPFKAAATSHKKLGDYEQPPIELFEKDVVKLHPIREKDIKSRMGIIEATLREFHINAHVVNYEIGPAVTTYELTLGEGQQIAALMSRQDEISMRLAVPPVRIVGPIPGKGTVGIEVPNPFPDTVRMRELFENNYKDLRDIVLPLVMGKTNAGDPIVKSLSDMPHMLIAGTTGSGKSVCLKSIITSLIVSMSWHEMKLLLIDPKMVELTVFDDIPHLWAPVVTDNKKAALVLDWLVKEMDERYMLLNKVGAGNIAKFNKLGPKKIADRLKEKGLTEEDISGFPTHLPYIVTVIDELADLMMTARKEVEHSIIRISQKARAIGIHLVVATQRPSTDVITGLIRSNMPARIAFKVASAIESGIILGKKGAERLLGKGDMLLMLPGYFSPVRAQCIFTSDEELRAVTNDLKSKAKPEFHDQLIEIDSVADLEGTDKDELFDDAVQVIIQEQRGSTSLLQRRMKIGYSRAARLMDAMAKFGIVGGFNGSSAREVMITQEDWNARRVAPGEAAE